MVRTRPLFGSTTSTLPLVVPNAPTAARRTVRSSPSTLSPSVGSTGGGFFTAFLTTFLLVVVAAFPLPEALLLAGWPAAKCPFTNRPATSAGSKNLFIAASLRYTTSIADCVSFRTSGPDYADYAAIHNKPSTHSGEVG